MSTPIAQFSGAALYLDTTAFYALLRALEPAAKDLFNRIERGDYRAYTSVLTFDELSYRLLLALIRDRYPGSPLDQLRQQEEKLIGNGTDRKRGQSTFCCYTERCVLKDGGPVTWPAYRESTFPACRNISSNGATIGEHASFIQTITDVIWRRWEEPPQNTTAEYTVTP